MNEKIRELMVNSGFATGYDRTQTGRWILSDKELEKFAELIVRECVKAIETNRKEPSEGYNTYNMGTFEAVDSIKQHFGVAE